MMADGCPSRSGIVGMGGTLDLTDAVSLAAGIRTMGH
jgi:hypothetical protein